MSYDLLFYFPIAPSAVPAPTRGVDSGLTVDGPYAIDPEDIDESYRHLVAACRYSLSICCTGSRENFEDLDRMKNEILGHNRGVVLVDNQIGIAVVEGREIAYAAQAAPREPDASISIYFEDGQRFETQLFDRFLDLLQLHIPEAMPRRYGPEEPLAYKLKDHGLDHFRAQWRKNPALAWQPNAPFVWISTHIPDRERDVVVRPGAQGAFLKQSPFLRYYRCSLIELRAKSRICHDAAALKRVRDFLADAAVLTDAFYSDIRIDSPQTAWWWHGIPAGKPIVAIAGPPYLDLWPEFVGMSRPLGASHRLASSLIDATTHEITIPTRLADPRDLKRMLPGMKELYAPVFPFQRPQPEEGLAKTS
jgi:hypothetical protein